MNLRFQCCRNGNGNHRPVQQVKQCQEVTIGNSGGNTKSANVDSRYRCPGNVDKNNWVGGDNHGDRFQITQGGNTVTARRLDYGGGWGMNLRIKCCTNGIAEESTIDKAFAAFEVFGLSHNTIMIVFALVGAVAMLYHGIKAAHKMVYPSEFEKIGDELEI